MPGKALNVRYLLLLLAVFLPISAVAADTPGGYAGPVPRSVGQAPVALLVDLSSGRTLFANNADSRFLPASMTKAMTLLTAFDMIKSGALREDTVITARPETARQWSGRGTTMFLQMDERITVGQLLAGIATVSANDASVVLAEGIDGSVAAWSERMNRRAQQIGMRGSHFANPNGFPDGGATYVTANDLARLAEVMIADHPDLYRRYISVPAIGWKGQTLTSHSPFVGKFPGGDGIKTGHTYEAGFNFLGSAIREGRRLVVVVGSVWTSPGRAQAARDLVEWGYSQFDSRRWLQPGQPVGRVRVQQGTVRWLPVSVAKPVAMTVPKGARGRAEGQIIYTGPLIAPIAKGTKVADLRVSVDGSLPYAIPLVAARDVGIAGPFDRAVNGLLGLWE